MDRLDCNRNFDCFVGAGIAIEKAYQTGGDRIRQTGVRIESLAKIESMDAVSGVVFA